MHQLILSQAERRALEAKTEFEQCGRLIKAEVVRFEQERIGDFKLSLQAFLDSMVEGQKQVSQILF
jgi:sorting nexin-1/2